MNKPLPFYLFFVFISIGMTTVAFSQDNFVPGSVITLSGDTLKGMIRDDRWKSSPLEIQFKNGNGVLSSFKPNAIAGFIINDKSQYISREINIDSTSIKLDYLPDSGQPAWKKDRVFLKYIVNSNVSLFSYEANDRIHFFIRQNGVIEELINHRYRTIYKGQGIVADNKMFVEQLKRYFKDCSSIKVNESYTEKSLTQLFVNYNQCTNHSSKIFSKKDKTILKVGVVAAVSYDKFNSSYQDYKSAVGYGAGGFVNLMFPNKNYKSSVYSELIYRKTGRQNPKSKSTEFYDIQSIQWTNIFRTRLLKSYSPLLIGAGVSFSGGLADSYLFSGADPSRKPFSAQAILNTAIVGDVSFVISKHTLINFRYETGDAVTFKDYNFGYAINKRSSSFRFSVAYQL